MGNLTLKTVRQILGSLPVEQRTVLVLVCVDGLRYAEAAQVLGIPIGTVMSRLARARIELRERLQEPARKASAPLRVIRSDAGEHSI